MSGMLPPGIQPPAAFAFQRDSGNVADQAKKLGVTYPVALDNDPAPGATTATSTGRPST